MLFALVSNKRSIRLSGTGPIKGLIPAALTEMESALTEVRGQRKEEKRRKKGSKGAVGNGEDGERKKGGFREGESSL